MAPQPAPGPTGNALTDAQAADVAAASQQAVNALIGIGQTVAQPQGSECLWPPPATWGLGFGPVRFSLGVPCLITKSEARAVIGAGVLGVGILVMFGGVQIMAVAAGVDIAVLAFAARGGVAGAARRRYGEPAPKPAKQPAKEDMTPAA